MYLGCIFCLFVVFDGNTIPGVSLYLRVVVSVFGDEKLEGLVHKLQIRNKINCIKMEKMEIMIVRGE